MGGERERVVYCGNGSNGVVAFFNHRSHAFRVRVCVFRTRARKMVQGKKCSRRAQQSGEGRSEGGKGEGRTMLVSSTLRFSAIGRRGKGEIRISIRRRPSRIDLFANSGLHSSALELSVILSI